ncbi:MAG: hypothetical protein SPF77_00025, partial [Gemmiger sp.]|uniref:hypothetical protein n=1 Tax=Gemmiger sp. TaxID=2049027 RepID=UPI002A90C419
RLAQRLEKCEISMQDNDERLGTRHPIKPAVMGFPADKVTCRMQTFESGITWICPYFPLFCFALRRLFSSFTLVFDTSDYIVLNVARGCLGNIWATLVFRATLFGAKQENLKIIQRLKIWLYFSPNLFSFSGGFPDEKHKSGRRKWRFYPQNARVFYCAE